MISNQKKSMIRRHHVYQTLICIVLVMLVANFITIIYVFRGSSSEHSFSDENIKAVIRSHNKKHHVFENEEIRSIRFIASPNGTIDLYSPFKIDRVIVEKILVEFKKLSSSREKIPTDGYIKIIGRIKRPLSSGFIDHSQNSLFTWDKISGWPLVKNEGHRLRDLGETLQFLTKVKIVQAKNSKKGTQLKLELILEDGQIALFKPKWYPKDVIISGETYSGKDRHYGEIAAFYLNIILGYDNSPITIGKKINLTEGILPFATDQLKETFFAQNGSICFYGVCLYCKFEDPVCSEEDGTMEGALILMIDQKIRTFPNPYRRTYKEKKYANWENDLNFCKNELSQKFRQDIILDLVAISIFDFLIGNGDRHHFETYVGTQESLNSHSKKILLIDNGKSFGNPNEDYIDILAPVYQCCKIRRELWRVLKRYQGILGKSVDAVSSNDPLYPLLTQDHLRALDRRLNIVLATIGICIGNHSLLDVLV